MAKHKVESDEFQQIKEIASGIRVSTLYNTLEDLHEAKKPCIAAYEITHIQSEQRTVFYVKFKQPTQHNLFASQGFKLTDYHLSIDKYFKESSACKRRGLDAAHYTEVYTHPETQQQLVIHLYLDRYASFQYIQAKRFAGKRDESEFEEFDLTHSLQNLLENNSCHARELLKKLLTENEALFRAASDNAEKHAEALDEISLNLNKSTLTKFIACAEKFISCIDVMNRYCDSAKDKRGDFIRQKLSHLKAFTSENCSETQEEECVSKLPTNSESFPATTEKSVTSALKAKSTKNDLLTAILTLEQQLTVIQKESSNTANIIQQAELIRKIEVNLLLISNFFDQLKPQQKQKLRSLSKIISGQKSLLQQFEEEFWKGNLSAVQRLYPYIEHHINWQFILYNILFILIEFIPTSDEHAQQLSAVFDFLYEKSARYRWTLCSQHDLLFILQLSNGTQLLKHAPLLSYACFCNNLFAFQLLLKHGMNPNGIGTLIDSKAYPLILDILFFSDQDGPQLFLKLILEHGADPNLRIRAAPTTIKIIDTNNGTTEEQFTSLAKKTPKSDSQSKIKKFVQPKIPQQFLSFETALATACDFQIIPAVELMLPYLSLENILFTLGNIIIHEPICRRYLPSSKQRGFFIADSVCDLHALTASLIDLDLTSPFYSVLVYTEEPQPELHIVELLATALSQRFGVLEKQDPSAIEALYNHFSTTAQGLKSKGIFNKKTVCYFECCILLLSFEKNPGFMTHQKIIQHYCQLAAVATKSADPELLSDINRFYANALELAEHSCYGKQLVQTPLYQHVLDNIDKQFLARMRSARVQLEDKTPCSPASS